MKKAIGLLLVVLLLVPVFSAMATVEVPYPGAFFSTYNYELLGEAAYPELGFTGMAYGWKASEAELSAFKAHIGAVFSGATASDGVTKYGLGNGQFFLLDETRFAPSIAFVFAYDADVAFVQPVFTQQPPLLAIPTRAASEPAATAAPTPKPTAAPTPKPAKVPDFTEATGIRRGNSTMTPTGAVQYEYYNASSNDVLDFMTAMLTNGYTMESNDVYGAVIAMSFFTNDRTASIHIIQDTTTNTVTVTYSGRDPDGLLSSSSGASSYASPGYTSSSSYAVAGGSAPSVSVPSRCYTCSGSGICPVCAGKRRFIVPNYSGGASEYVDCTACSGSGKCWACGGTGKGD